MTTKSRKNHIIDALFINNKINKSYLLKLSLTNTYGLDHFNIISVNYIF